MPELIWTKHALQRISERQFPQDLALQTFHDPDRKFRGKEPGSIEYQKWFGKSRVTVIGKQNEQGEWLVLSCWIDPPLPGTDDDKKRQEYLRYHRLTGWKRWLWAILRQLGF